MTTTTTRTTGSTTASEPGRPGRRPSWLQPHPELRDDRPRSRTAVAALTAGLLGSVTCLGLLMAVGLAHGRSVFYPLGAVAAVFRGDRALGLPPHVGEISAAAAARGTVWALVLGVSMALLFAAATRHVPLGARRALPFLGAATALAVATLVYALCAHPGSLTMQREISSFEGIRQLGLGYCALATAAAGLVVGLVWSLHDRAHRSVSRAIEVEALVRRLSA